MSHFSRFGVIANGIPCAALYEEKGVNRLQSPESPELSYGCTAPLSVSHPFPCTTPTTARWESLSQLTANVLSTAVSALFTVLSSPSPADVKVSVLALLGVVHCLDLDSVNAALG